MALVIFLLQKWVDLVPESTKVYISKYCIFDLLALKSLRMICRQSRVDICANILNPGPLQPKITTQVHQRFQNIDTLTALHI